MNRTLIIDEVSQDYEYLQSVKSSHVNSEYFSRMLSSWMNGSGNLPDSIGMSSVDEFQSMLEKFFSGICLSPKSSSGIHLSRNRQDEFEVLRDLLLSHRAGRDETEAWLAEIIAAGSLGQDHLWQDLGLWSRNDLSFILNYNFHDLFIKNTADMKWKKFFYRQFCIHEGISICKSPSCEVCRDYNLCFGPE